MKTLICLLGGSGSGKDSIAKKLENDGFKFLKSYTTRPQRKGEGNTHIFIKSEDVENHTSDIIAYTEISPYIYFATIQQLLDSDVYIIDPNGLKFLKDKITNIKLIPIFINVSEQKRFTRAMNRGDKKEDIEKRFSSEFEQFDQFRKSEEYYSVINDDLDTAYQIVKAIIEKETGGNCEHK